MTKLKRRRIIRDILRNCGEYADKVGSLDYVSDAKLLRIIREQRQHLRSFVRQISIPPCIPMENCKQAGVGTAVNWKAILSS
jgi:hypothetical protein